MLIEYYEIYILLFNFSIFRAMYSDNHDETHIEVMNGTTDEILVLQPKGGFHCSKDALTDVFGWFLQVLLACLAFTCLIGGFCYKCFDYY